MGLNVHRGWHVYGDYAAPVTSQWKANRHGVGMCAGSLSALLAMIDRRVYEEQEAKRIREGGTHGRV